MTHIFRHKLVLRATAPISFQSAFKKLDLNILNHSQESDSLFCNFVESICWKICRETQVACIFIPFNGFKIHLIYQKGQNKVVEKAVTELERHLSVEMDRTADEDAGSSPLMVKAVECGMISALLNQGWTSLENGLMINGNIALMEEGTAVEAVSVGLQIEEDDRMVFIIAPDVVRFHRLKIHNLLPVEMKQRFDDGHEINLEDWLWHHKDDGALDQIRCFVLPSLVEGFVIGLSKLLPQEKDFEESNQLWLHKHGLELSKVCYYVKVQYIFDDEIFKTWFPSDLVIKGSGLMPVTHKIRALKVAYAHGNFRRSIAAWNFFEGGTPTFLDFDQINPSQDVSTWVTAKDVLQPRFRKNHRDNPCISDDSALCSLTDFFSNLDFRRPKLVSAMMELKNKDIQSFSEGNMNQYHSSPIPRAILMNTAKIVPRFINRLVVHEQNATSDFCRPKLVSTMIEPRGKDIQNLAEVNMNQYHASPIPRAIPMDTAKIVPHFINRLVVQGRNVTAGHKIGTSTNKTQGADILTKDIAAMSNKKIVEADNCISPSIPAEVRQYPLKAPSFARRKSSTATLCKTGKAESKNMSIKNAVGGITNITTRIQNLQGMKVSKKKPSGADRKSVPGSLQKNPNNAQEGASTGSKKTKDLSKGLASKKKDAAYSTAKFQASDTKRNHPEKGKLSGHSLKATKSPNGQMRQATTLIFELQHNEIGRSINLSQDILAVENTCAKGFSGQTTACAIVPEKGSKRKMPSATEDEIDVFKVKTKEGEIQCSLKKARPEQKVVAALPDETNILINGHCEVIPGVEIKHNNAKKRNSIAIDLTALDGKVRDCHSKGNLKSLTVPELKSFLSANKTKVGGKKEELIQRITSLLSN